MIKALSAAINDPTTAVLAIDRLQRLLRLAARPGFDIVPEPEDRAVRICRLSLGDG